MSGKKWKVGDPVLVVDRYSYRDGEGRADTVAAVGRKYLRLALDGSLFDLDTDMEKDRGHSQVFTPEGYAEKLRCDAAVKELLKLEIRFEMGGNQRLRRAAPAILEAVKIILEIP